MVDARSTQRSLWRDHDFMTFWVGETISLFGSQVTLLALPFTAIVLLDASPSELGFIGAAGVAPFLLLTLFVGVAVDRWSRRRMMLVANVARGVLLAVIPVLAVFEVLKVWQLVLIAFGVGVGQVFFELAYQSYVPHLVSREQLVEGNGKLQASAAAADVGGPGLAGLLIQAVTAPYAVVIDAVSFLLSAAAIARMRAPEPPVERRGRPRVLAEIGEGLRLVFGNRYLRAMAGEATTYNLGFTVIETVFLLYAVDELGLNAAVVGLVFSIGSVGALLGALLAEPARRRVGLGVAMTTSYVFACLPALLIPLAGPGVPFVVGLLAGTYLLVGFGVASSQVYVYSLRQGITPDRLLGRMNSAYRFFVTGMLPIGALLGGALGELIGLRPTLVVGSVLVALAVVWILASPIPRLRDIPQLPGHGATVGAYET